MHAYPLYTLYLAYIQPVYGIYGIQPMYPYMHIPYMGLYTRISRDTAYIPYIGRI